MRALNTRRTGPVSDVRNIPSFPSENKTSSKTLPLDFRSDLQSLLLEFGLIDFGIVRHLPAATLYAL